MPHSSGVIRLWAGDAQISPPEENHEIFGSNPYEQQELVVVNPKPPGEFFLLLLILCLLPYVVSFPSFSLPLAQKPSIGEDHVSGVMPTLSVQTNIYRVAGADVFNRDVGPALLGLKQKE
jgi:hypothetical protein